MTSLLTGMYIYVPRLYPACNYLNGTAVGVKQQIVPTEACKPHKVTTLCVPWPAAPEHPAPEALRLTAAAPLLLKLPERSWGAAVALPGSLVSSLTGLRSNTSCTTEL